MVFLLNGDGRGDALDGIDEGLVHAVEELANVGGKGLHVAALAFGVQCVKGEGGFPGAGEGR